MSKVVIKDGNNKTLEQLSEQLIDKFPFMRFDKSFWEIRVTNNKDDNTIPVYLYISIENWLGSSWVGVLEEDYKERKREHCIGVVSIEHLDTVEVRVEKYDKDHQLIKEIEHFLGSEE